MEKLNSEANCCRLCFLNNIDYMNLIDVSTSGLSIGKTIEKYFRSEVPKETKPILFN